MKNNVLLTLMIFALLSFTAKAQTLENSLLSCTKIQDSLARLTCFDDVAERARKSTAKVVKPSAMAIVAETEKLPTPATPKLPTKAESFGAEHLKKTNVSKEDLQIVFTVDKISKDHYGKLRFTFKNGQQWQQTDSAFLRVKAGDSVLLKKGFMDAVYLKKNQSNSSKKIRVKRQK